MSKINLIDLQKRKFQASYLAWFVFTKNIKVRLSSCIEVQTLYCIYGIDKLGNRQVLGMFFENENDNRFWLEVFEDFKARNAQNVFFIVTPNNRNLERCVKIVYNSIRVVHSPDSIIESITKYFSDKPSRALRTSFKNLFLAKDLQALELELQFFKDKYIDNKVILMLLGRKELEIKKFYQYSYDIRKFLYPYYSLHEFKKFLNKLNTLDNLSCSINEIIEFCLPYINHFELGRTQYKSEWLNLISIFYETFSNEMEVYI